jgi:diamine N-acetyltransferase
MIYRPALPADGPALAQMARRCFTDTFGTLYRPEDLAAFLDRTFGEQGLPAQLHDPRYTVRLALDGEDVIGFAKLGPVDFPGEWSAETTELHQLYVLGPWQGAGVAPQLMDWAVATARARGYARLVLSVYVDNHRAQRFYARYGFREIGKYEFRVGDHVDDDRIWSLDL